MSSAAVPSAPVSGRAWRDSEAWSYPRKVLMAQLAFIVGLVLLAELATRWSGLDHELLPPPSLMVKNIVAILQLPEIRAAIGAMLYQLLMSIVISAVLGTVLGYVVGAWERFEKISLPVVLLVYSIPQVTVLPLFVLFFGPASGSKIAFGVSHGMFPIALSVVAGLQHSRAHPIYSTWARSLGASPVQKLLRVQLPLSLGAILVGLRLCISMSLLGVLLADIYVSAKGVGYFARLYTETLQGPRLFALITLLACLAMAINSLVSQLEKRSSRWQVVHRSH